MTKLEAEAFFQRQIEIGPGSHRQELKLSEVDYAAQMRKASDVIIPASVTDKWGRGVVNGKYEGS